MDTPSPKDSPVSLDRLLEQWQNEILQNKEKESTISVSNIQDYVQNEDPSTKTADENSSESNLDNVSNEPSSILSSTNDVDKAFLDLNFILDELITSPKPKDKIISISEKESIDNITNVQEVIKNESDVMIDFHSDGNVRQRKNRRKSRRKTTRRTRLKGQHSEDDRTMDESRKVLVIKKQGKKKKRRVSLNPLKFQK